MAKKGTEDPIDLEASREYETDLHTCSQVPHNRRATRLDGFDGVLQDLHATAHT